MSATTGAAVGGATAGAGGVAFPATAVAVADANTLDDYEEGSWTPVVTSGVGTITTVGAVTGKYTKIGNVVIAHYNVTITTNGTGSGSLVIAGLPFTSSGTGAGSGFEVAATGKTTQVRIANAATQVSVYYYDATYPGGDATTNRGTIVYLT
jgi:hypothetical protein